MDEIERGWDIVARNKYRDEFKDHVAFLKEGGHSLLPPESSLLSGILSGAHVVHFQCSHGLETLGLLNAGAGSAVGIDISAEMIRQAREKADATGLPGRFLKADVLDPPEEVRSSAAVLYTGRGSLSWVRSLTRWAASIHGTLEPGGHLVLFEGHPLDALWVRDAPRLELRPGASYFRGQPEEQEGFPSSVVERSVGPGGPRMPECAWRPGEVIGALLHVRLELVRFDEHPDPFWDQFPEWPDELRAALPHGYSILARRPR